MLRLVSIIHVYHFVLVYLIFKVYVKWRCLLSFSATFRTARESREGLPLRPPRAIHIPERSMLYQVCFCLCLSAHLDVPHMQFVRMSSLVNREDI